jgi:hypothetical protein
MTTVTLQNWQLYVLALAASLLVIVLSWLGEKVIPWLAAKFGKTWKVDFGRLTKQVLVVLVSAGFAFWWFPFSLPVFPMLIGTFWPQVWQGILWLVDVLKALMPYVGAASTIYNMVLTYIFDPDKRAKAIQALWDLILAWLKTPRQ